MLTALLTGFLTRQDCLTERQLKRMGENLQCLKPGFLLRAEAEISKLGDNVKQGQIVMVKNK